MSKEEFVNRALRDIAKMKKKKEKEYVYHKMNVMYKARKRRGF